MFVDIMHLCVTGTPVYHVWVYACVCGHVHEMQLSLYVYVYPWRRKWLPTPVFLPGKSHGQKSLACYSPWCCKRAGHDLAAKKQQLMLRNSLLDITQAQSK